MYLQKKNSFCNKFLYDGIVNDRTIGRWAGKFRFGNIDFDNEPIGRC